VDAQGAPREVRHGAAADLLRKRVGDGLDGIKTGHLCTFDGEAGCALGQGQ
jgi:isocitrate dehydrogenase